MVLSALFFWLEVGAFAVQVGFAVRAIRTKDWLRNLMPIVTCMVFVLLFLALYWITK